VLEKVQERNKAQPMLEQQKMTDLLKMGLIILFRILWLNIGATPGRNILGYQEVFLTLWTRFFEGGVVISLNATYLHVSTLPS
jgi:hypothetical protein